MPSAGISPEAVPRKGGRKKGNRINSNTGGFVARNKGLKNERDHQPWSLLAINKVGREAPARDDHSRGDLVIAVWLGQGQRRPGRAGQQNRKPNRRANMNLPFAHAPVKASPLRFDPLPRRLTPTIDNRSASGPGPNRQNGEPAVLAGLHAITATNFRSFTEFMGAKD